jgi:signal transduction histidine kinase
MNRLRPRRPTTASIAEMTPEGRTTCVRLVAVSLFIWKYPSHIPQQFNMEWAYADAAPCRKTDDGHGFSFRGTYDLATLQQIKAGPTTLKERVSALGGDFVIVSSEAGSRLSISLPLHETVV